MRVGALSRTVLVALLSAALLSVAAAQSASARSFVIEARGGSDSRPKVFRIGDFRPSRDSSLEAALKAYGKPSSRRANNGGCRLAWRGLGIRMLFSNFSLGSACDPRRGDAQIAVLRGRRWRTARGLHIGDRPRRLRRLYPRARRVKPRSYRIFTNDSPVGRYAVLSARTSRGRISSFRLFIGGAGE